MRIRFGLLAAGILVVELAASGLVSPVQESSGIVRSTSPGFAEPLADAPLAPTPAAPSAPPVPTPSAPTPSAGATFTPRQFTVLGAGDILLHPGLWGAGPPGRGRRAPERLLLRPDLHLS